MKSRHTRWIVLLSLLWAAALVLNFIPILRGDFGWRWPYQLPQDLTRLLPLVLALLLYVIGLRWLMRRRAAVLLIWAIVGSTGLTVAGLFVRGDPLFTLYSGTVDPGTTGWHFAAARIKNLDTTLRDWPNVMQHASAYSAHLRLSPPGLTLIYYAADQLLAGTPAIADALGRPLRAAQCQNYRVIGYSNAQLASAWLGMLMPLWGALTVLPLYALGRRVFGEQAACWSVAWWPLVPAMLMFTQTPNTFYPFVAVSIIALSIEGLWRNSAVRLMAAGVLMSILTFMNLSVLPLLGLIGLLFMGVNLAQAQLSIRSIAHLNWRKLFRLGFVFGLGVASIWLIYYLVYGVSGWSILQVMSDEHLALDRPYFPWLFLHLNDFFMFTGWPLTLVAAVAVWRAARSIRRGVPLTLADSLIWATLITLLVVDVSGIMRGETGRVLLFMSPLVLLIAAYTVNASPSNKLERSGWWLTAAQSIMVIVILAVIPVNSPAFRQPPTVPTVADLPNASPQTTGAVFGNVLRLQSFAGQIELRNDAAGRAEPLLILQISWQSSGQVDVPYYLAFIPVAPNGQPAPQANLQQPFAQQYPTTCWSPHSGLMQDRLEIPLFSNARGDWWVSFSLVDGETGEKLAVTLSDGSRSDQIGLGPFRLP